MLELEALDLDDLCAALDDNSHEHSWWLDPRSGAVHLHAPDVDDTDWDDLDEAGLVPIDAVTSHEAYADMEDFVAQVADRRVAGRLERALGGRGPFRRFKDELYDHPEVQQQWYAFKDARLHRRAIEWLAEQGLVAEGSARRAVAEHEQLTAMHTPSSSLAARVAGDLRGLYSHRLVDVLVFGSWARGDADEESDLDLLVVLDELASPWDELRRMDELLWRHTEESGTVISALPVSRAELAQPTSPVVLRAAAEAVPAG